MHTSIETNTSIGLQIPTGSSKWLNPQEPDESKRLTLSCAKAIKRYMDQDKDHELGCLVVKDTGDVQHIVPFTNGAPGQLVISMTEVLDFDYMARVLLNDRLWGWFHSHPHGAPYPSSSDITHHSLNVNMGIYGGATSTISIFNTRDLERIETPYKKQVNEEN